MSIFNEVEKINNKLLEVKGFINLVDMLKIFKECEKNNR
jgi:hypothetical protein